MSNSSRRRWLLFAMLVLCIVALGLRYQHIEAAWQYPRIADEIHIAPAAAKVLRTGDFHPGVMRYPALAKYIAAAGMAVGFVAAAANQEIRSVREIGSVGFPYYTHPRIVIAARLTFALLSVATMAATGWLAWRLFGQPGLLFTAPFVLALSGHYFEMSWRYLNVDVVATFFVTMGLLALVSATKAPFSLMRLAVLPAVCAGLAAASKYPHGLLLIPVVVAIVLCAPAERRLPAVAVAVLAAGVAFVAANPFALLDLPAFLNGIAFEVRHYATGHAGHDPAKGLPKLAFYARAFAKDFGVAAAVAGAVGLCAGAWLDWRRTAMVASFAFALLALLAAQRVHFDRNILPLFPLAAVFVAAGIHFAYGQLARRVLAAGGRGGGLLCWARWVAGRPWRRTGLRAATFAVLCIVALPMYNVAAQLAPAPNSRHQTVSWIMQNLPSDTTLIVPAELGLDTRPLAEAGHPVRIVDFVPLDTGEAIAATTAGISPVAVLLTKWHGDHRSPNAELAARLNGAAAQAPLETIATFGRLPVKVSLPRIYFTSPVAQVSIAVPRSAERGDR